MRHKLNLIDLHKFAGFFIGEGYCYYNAKQNAIRVTVAQVEHEPLLWIQERLGGKIQGPYSYAKAYKSKNPKQVPYRYWTHHGPAAAGILMTLFSLVRDMSPKRAKQIGDALKSWKVAPLSKMAAKRLKTCGLV